MSRFASSIAILAVLVVASLGSARAQLPDACAWDWSEGWKRNSFDLVGPTVDLGGRLLTWQWESKPEKQRTTWEFDLRADEWLRGGLPSDVVRLDTNFYVPKVATAQSADLIAVFGDFLWADQPVGGLLFDRTSRCWSPISKAGSVVGSQAFWTGSRFVVFASEMPGAIYDPVADRWEPMPMLPVASSSSGNRDRVVWARDRLMAVINRSYSSVSKVLTWKPGDDSWAEIGTAPYPIGNAVWTGEAMYFTAWGGLAQVHLDGTFDLNPIPDRPSSSERPAWETLLYWNRRLILSSGIIYPPCDACGPGWLAPEWLILDIDRMEWSMVAPTPESNRLELFYPIVTDDGQIVSVSASGNVHRLAIAEERWLPAHWEPGYLPWDASVVWTGRELVTYGGTVDGYPTAVGYRFDPETGRVDRLSDDGVRPRAGHLGVWAGDSMIVFSGCCYNGGVANADRWRPETNSWEALPIEDPPTIRWWYDPVGVWTGSELLAYWSDGSGDSINTGIRYSPETGAWAFLPPIDDSDHLYPTVATWTGNEFLLWGESRWKATGALYDPTSNEWHTIPAVPITGFRFGGAVWTGTELVTWDLGDECRNGLEDDRLWRGAAYDPQTDSWRRYSDQLISCSRADWRPWTAISLGDSILMLDSMVEVDSRTGSIKEVPIVAGTDFFAWKAIWTGTRLLSWDDESVHSLIEVAGPPSAPELLAPVEESTGVRLSWSETHGAVSFSVDLGMQGAMERVAQSIPWHGVFVPDLELGASYQWRVTAENECGMQSTEGSFQTEPFHADFDPVEPTAQWKNLTFRDRSWGHPRSWVWDFGDGYSSTSRNAVHAYFRPGRYEVRLTVTADEGISSVSRTIEITPSDADSREWLAVGTGVDGYRTSIELNSPADRTVRLIFVPTGADPVIRDWFLEANRSRILSDLLEEGIGIAAPANGRLIVLAEDSDPLPTMVVRRWRSQAAGEVGGEILVQEGDRSAPLRYRGLGRSGSRTELYLRSALGAVPVQLTAFDREGPLGSITIEVPEKDTTVIAELAAAWQIVDGRAFDVEISAPGVVLSTCLVEDLGSGDVLSVPEAGEGLALVASITGLDAQVYRTRLVAGASAPGGNAEFVPRGVSTPTATREIPESAGEATPNWDDVLPELFGLGEAVGQLQCSGSAVGWGEVWTEGPAGRVGVEVGPPDVGPRTSDAWLFGIDENAARRTNLWIGVDQDTEFTISIHHTFGGRLTSANVLVPAGGRFFSNVVRGLGIDDLTSGRIGIFLRIPHGDVSFQAWATVIDRATLDARIVRPAGENLRVQRH